MESILMAGPFRSINKFTTALSASEVHPDDNARFKETIRRRRALQKQLDTSVLRSSVATGPMAATIVGRSTTDPYAGVAMPGVGNHLNVPDKRGEFLTMPAQYSGSSSTTTAIPGGGPYQKTVERRRIVHIRSQDRDKTRYPNMNNFTIPIGYFRHVKQVRMVFMEFTNAANAINEENNKISWQNYEDATLDPPFPTYTAQLRPGTYGVDAIKSEIQRAMNSVDRKKNGANHFFTIETTLERNLIAFTSYDMIALPNSLSSVIGSNSIKVTWDTGLGEMPFAVGDHIYVSGAKNFSDIPGLYMTGPMSVDSVSGNTFKFSIPYICGSTVNLGGGLAVLIGKPISFKLDLSGANSMSDVLGFEKKESTSPIPSSGAANLLQTHVLPVTGASLNLAGTAITLTLGTGHNIKAGHLVCVDNLETVPDMRASNPTHIFRVVSATTTTITISFTAESVICSDSTVVRTSRIGITYPNHSFRVITLIKAVAGSLQVTTKLPHGLAVGGQVRFSSTDSLPTVDGLYTVSSVTSSYVFTVPLPSGVTSLTHNGTFGVFGTGKLRLYNIAGDDVCGINVARLAFGVQLPIIDTPTANTVEVYVEGGFPTASGYGGGGDITISSDYDGYAKEQTNSTSDNEGVGYAPLILSGPNYVFFCCPELGDDVATGSIANVFTRIALSQGSGSCLFNTMVPAERVFWDSPLNELTQLTIQLRGESGAFFENLNVDMSFSLEIVETIDTSSEFNQSTQRIRG